MRRGDRERLQDILEAVEKIQEKTQRGRPAFAVDEMLRVWVIHHLEILGEAARALGVDVREKALVFPGLELGT